MKINEAEKIIDSMYQNKMCSMEEKTNEGVTIHLGTKVDFTKEEEASVILLRELQILRGKANKYDSLVNLIKEEIKNRNIQAKEHKDNTILTIIGREKEVLQKILETIGGEE